MSELSFGPRDRVINVFSNDGGQTYNGIGLGSLMTREAAEKALDGAASAINLDPEGLTIHGTTTSLGSGEVLGVVGISFREPLTVDVAAALAVSLIIDRTDLIGINLGRVGNSESLTRIPYLNPHP
ncbi:MAG: hypothetical protein ACREGD_02710 [Candidatus Saccharimonadales bacterium]